MAQKASEIIVSKNLTIAFLDISTLFLKGFELIKKCQLVSLKMHFIRGYVKTKIL
jgi:hypothetical protein